jgi:hypothetical protein
MSSAMSTAICSTTLRSMPALSMHAPNQAGQPCAGCLSRIDSVITAAMRRACSSAMPTLSKTGAMRGSPFEVQRGAGAVPEIAV